MIISIEKLFSYSSNVLMRMYKCRRYFASLSENTQLDIVEILADRYYDSLLR